MGLRYLGNIIRPGYDPLASNITTGVNTAQHQGVFTLQQQAQAQSTQSWVTEPLFDFNTLLLQADGTVNGSQNSTFLDSSSNNFAITRNGNTTQGSFTPFSVQPGAWSNFFLTSDNYFGVAGNAAFSFTANFTVECFVYQVARSDNGVVTEISSYLDGVMIRLGTIGGIYDTVYVNGTNVASISSVVPLNVWTHIAVVRSGSTVTVYVNGISRGTATVAGTVNTTSGAVRIAAPLHTTPGTQPFQGYISNFRILKGTAQYTSNFTPPTAPLTNITNTSLLTCQSNQFIDNSTANSGSGFTITTVGTPSVQAFSPFAPQFQWTPSVIGGSGYFDGTGDYLSLSNSGLEPTGTNDFTYETWVYNNGFSGSQYGRGIVTFFAPASYGNNRLLVRLNNGYNVINFYLVVGGSVLAGTNGTDGTRLLTPNAWSHLAVVRRNGVFTVYINGVQDINITNLTTVSLTGFTSMEIGRNQDGGTPDFFGYMSNTRYIRSQALTSGAFTPPTALVTSTAVGWTGANAATSITGTVALLLNFTNAGIYDGTMKNNLETVGNAQVSTAVVKYGSGSMAFDGTGDAFVSPNSLNFNFGAGDFTIEAWVYPTARGVYPMICKCAVDGTWATGWTFCFGYQSTEDKLQFWINGSNILQSTNAVPLNTWSHVAVSRAGTSLQMFVNGVQQASATNSTAISPTSVFTVGSDITTGNYNYFGYIDDLRITRGIARYTQNFIPPSVALPRQ